MSADASGMSRRSVTRLVLLPLAVYGLAFALLTHPLLARFSSHYFADDGDGLQNVWNLWWVNKAVTELHQSPWYTPYLHSPRGTSLIGHTLNPFNGFVAIPLLRFISLVETHNAIVVGAFVTGGLTAFWLAYRVTGSVAGSLVAGFVFTFSNYHFAHAQGHLQLVSLEWIPLFLLCWLALLDQPTPGMALAAAATLCLVILCDYYYFFYCTIAALLMALWHTARARDPLALLRRPFRIPLAVFLATAAVTSGTLAIALVLANASDPLTGSHPTTDLSLDLLAPLIPGGHWRFRDWTRFYWWNLPGTIHESSVHLGLAVLGMVAFAWRRRRTIGADGLGPWFLLLAVFAVLSLGPVLHVGGRAIGGAVLPYAWLERLLPPLKLSGVPVRMMVMVTLAAGVLCAVGVKGLLAAGSQRRWVLAPWLALLWFEYLPFPIPTTRIEVPPYVEALRRAPRREAVLDNAVDAERDLYYQTVHEKPLCFGYVARLPTSVVHDGKVKEALLRRRRFDVLCQRYGVAYVVANRRNDPVAHTTAARVLFEDADVRVYDLGPCPDRAARERTMGSGAQADRRDDEISSQAMPFRHAAMEVAGYGRGFRRDIEERHE